MGTRNLICVQHEGKYKVAQYCQWDGYPSGQGIEMLRWLRDSFDREKFIKALANTYVATDVQRDRLFDHKKNEWRDTGKSLSRDPGAKVLGMIQEATIPLPLGLELEFASNGLFCEWVWVLDLDVNTFEGFKGCNKEPLGQYARFANTPKELDDKGQPKDTGEYHPAVLVKLWTLDRLPTDKEFLIAMGEPEEAEKIAEPDAVLAGATS